MLASLFAFAVSKALESPSRPILIAIRITVLFGSPIFSETSSIRLRNASSSSTGMGFEFFGSLNFTERLYASKT